MCAVSDIMFLLKQGPFRPRRYCQGLREELATKCSKGQHICKSMTSYCVQHLKDKTKITEDKAEKTIQRSTTLYQLIKDIPPITPEH